MPRPLAIVAEPISPAALEWLAARAEVVEARPDEQGFAEAAPRAEALVVRTYTKVDGDLLARLPALRVVGRAGVGLDSIDLAEAGKRGIEVVSTPDANTQAVVEYVLCLLCDALRPRVFLDAPVDKAAWDEVREEVCASWQMDELVLGILGMGRIGRRVAAVGRAIGFDLLYCDLLEIPPSQRSGARPVTAEALFSEADVVTIHIDGRPENRDFVGQGMLSRMRPDAVLINTSRGRVLDHAALGAFLRANPASQAILDVHEPEPFTESHPLLGLPNAHLAPHLAARTASAMDAMSWVVRDVVAVLAGQRPRHPARR